MSPTSALDRSPAATASGSQPRHPFWRQWSVRRQVWGLLAVWALLWGVICSFGGMYSWHYFATGGQEILTPNALHVFALHPELQVGPLSLVAAGAIVGVGGHLALAMAGAVMLMSGLVTLQLLVRSASLLLHTPPSPEVTVLAGLLLLPAWAVLAVHYGHLDDVLALTLTSGAVAAIVRRRPWLATLLLAGATACKPWALGFAALLLLFRHPARLILAFGLAVAATWFPFVIADPGTLRLGAFRIANAPDSALRALGVTTSGTPSWDRAAQLALGFALAVWAIRRGRAAAVPLVVLATRMLLDPGTYPYYSTGLLLAALIADLVGSPRRLIPVHAVAVGSWWLVDLALKLAGVSGLGGVVRATFLTALLAIALLTNRGPWPPMKHSPVHPSAGPQRPATSFTSEALP